MNAKTQKSLALAVVLSLLALGILAVILQLTLKSLPKTHPVFSYITLTDKDLPYFNKKNFSAPVYALYALDEAIARGLAQSPDPAHPEPLGKLSATAYSRHLVDPIKAPEGNALDQKLKSSETLDPLIYEVKTNAQGFRSPPIVIPKPANTLRIVAAGDSLTFGFGVSAEKTWVAQLAEALQREAPNNLQVEVINAGVISFDSTLGRHLIESKILPLQPDWILLGYGFNDYSGNARFFAGGADYTKAEYWAKLQARQKSFWGRWLYAAQELRLLQLPVHYLDEMKKNLAARQAAISFPVLKERLEQMKGKHNIDLATYRTNIEAILQLCEKNHIKALALNSNITSPYGVESLRQLSERFQVPFADFRSILGQSLQVEEDLTSGQVPVTFSVKVPENLRGPTAQFYLLGSFFSAVEFGATPLRDDGKSGDLVANDGIYAATLPLTWATILEFRFGRFDGSLQAAEAAAKGLPVWLEEFHGWKVYRRFYVSGDTVATAEGEGNLRTPVYDFDDLKDRSHTQYPFHPVMSEICHPNSLGHRILAQSLSDTLVRQLGWR